jgi:hypothetical protein
MCTENHVCFGRIHGSQLREERMQGNTHLCVRTRVRTRTYVPWYVPHVRTVHVYVRTYHLVLIMLCHNFLVPWDGRAMVQYRVYHGTYTSTIGTYHGTYMCTIGTGTLASGRCQHRRHHGILQLRFQLDSAVCSADLHHNPRSIWACTRTSACIASLRTVSVVVRVCGFHGWVRDCHRPANTPGHLLHQGGPSACAAPRPQVHTVGWRHLTVQRLTSPPGPEGA